MVFCRECGGRVAATAKICTGCSAGQGAADVGGPATETELSPLWARRFALIERAGGSSLPRLRTLSFGDSWRIKANLLAFLFGPIYYAVKGMWKKGLTLFALVIVVVGLGEAMLEAFGIASSVLLFVGPAVFSRFANPTYYRLVKEGRNGWW